MRCINTANSAIPRSVPFTRSGFFMASVEDIKYIRHTFLLAEKARGLTTPNPLVGAVIVKNHNIISSGFHRAAGKPHAEIVALKKAGPEARNATLYVNLEPCCHIGRTGPCTDAIIKARIRKVVVAAKDPNPLVNGKGIKQLRKAGIEVISNVLSKEAKQLNEIYFGYFVQKRPFIILKLAQSLDGNIATQKGDSKYLSSEKSLQYAHRLRSEVDAVMIGGSTARIDDPRLTVRRFNGKNPYRIILTNDKLPVRKLKLISENDDYKTIIATSEKYAQIGSAGNKKSKAIFWTIKQQSNKYLDLNDFIRKATEFGIRSLLVEGGAALAASFIKANLVDKYIFITTPQIIGAGTASVGPLPVSKIAQAVPLTNLTAESSGSDIILTAYPGKAK